MFLKFCSVIVISFLFLGCSSIDVNAKLMNALDKIDGTNHKVNKKKPIQHMSVKSEGIRKIPPLKLNKLKVNVKEVKIVHSNTKLGKEAFYYRNVFTKVIMRNNKQILGFLDFEKDDTLFIIGKKIDGDLKKIIQPLKNKNFFIIITEGGGAFYNQHLSFYNMDTGVYKKIPGFFSAILDIDGDGLPEFFTYTGERRNKIGYLYKIIHPYTDPSLALITKNPLPSNVTDKQLQIDYYSDEVDIPQIKYSQQDNIVYPTVLKKIELDDNKAKAQKIYNSYFQKWDKGNLQIKSTYVDLSDYSFHGDLTSYSLSPIEEVKLKSMGLNLNNECSDFRLKNYRKEIIKFAQQKGWVYLPNLLICYGGKGYTKLSNGLLAIFDYEYQKLYKWDGHYLYYPHNLAYIMNKSKIFNHNVELISTYAKYLIAYDLDTNKNRLFFWKDILGYQPLFVKYFDGKHLVVIDKKNIIHIYNVSFSYSKVKKETW